jgi:transposase
MLTQKRAQELLEVLDEVRETHFQGRKKEYPYAEWEKKREKVKGRLRNLRVYVKQAVDALQREEQSKGRPPVIDLEKKVMLFLYARMLNKSNRGMEELLEVFQPLFGFDVSYKTIERLYSDEEVSAALHNLFILLVKEEGDSGNFSGDGSGYSLSVETHYRTQPIKKGKKYVYTLKIIDIENGMYVGIGFSTVSEMDGYRKAIALMKANGIVISSISLDKYYSSRKVIEQFGKSVSIFVIPKKNIANFGARWVEIFKRIADDPVAFLKRYFLRNLSEAGFSSDKRRFGSVIRQVREERRENALFSIAVLHNLWAIRVNPLTNH